MKLKLLLFSVLSVLLTSCAPQLSSFTRTLYDDQRFSDSDLKRIQFFLSEDLVLYRYLDEKGEFEIKEGSVRVRNGRKTEEIIIKRGTPGVFIARPESDHFSISFEEADDSKFLTFGPNPKNGGVYELLASKWTRGTGTVTYANAKFNTYSDAIPRLMVDLKKSQYRSSESTRASGRRVE
jgi:hypothetical protein